MVKKETKHRKVKYQKHGILTKAFNIEEETWIFETEDEEFQFVGAGLTTVLNDLSIDGYELVCCIGGDDYILRTKFDIEETQEVYDSDKTDEDVNRIFRSNEKVTLSSKNRSNA